jgi:hypothetical protein
MAKNRSIIHQLHSRVVAAICFALLVVSPALAQTESATVENKWQFTGALYLWGYDVGGTTKRGSDIEADFDDLLDATDFAFMGALEARKNKWLLFTDLINFDISSDSTSNLSIPIGPIHLPVTTTARTDLKGWVVNLAGGYNVYSQNKTRLDVIGGARYLDLSMDLFLQLQSLGPGRSRTFKESHSILDGIIGLKGKTALGERWFLGYYADVGGGDSSLTWQASALIGYQPTRWLDLALGYTHLEWDFGSTPVIDNLNFSGPNLGVIFHW